MAENHTRPASEPSLARVEHDRSFAVEKSASVVTTRGAFLAIWRSFGGHSSLPGMSNKLGRLVSAGLLFAKDLSISER
jgi:hypothetical protein